MQLIIVLKTILTHIIQINFIIVIVNQSFFIHAREEKDITWIKSYCYNKGIFCKSILIKRPNTTKKGNHADDNVEQYTKYDYTILNKGTLKDFKKKAQDFFEYNIEEYQPVCTTATDSADVAYGLENFEYKPEKTNFC